LPVLDRRYKVELVISQINYKNFAKMMMMMKKKCLASS